MSTAQPLKEGLPVYLVVGDDPHLTSEALDKLLEGIDPSSVNEFGPVDEFDLVMQAIVTPSMFDDRRTVVVHEVDKLAAEQQRRLTVYLEKPVEGATLILTGTRMPPAMLAGGRKNGHLLDVAKGRRSDLMLWLKHEFTNKGLQVGGDAMNTLIDAVGEQRLALSRAVEEISLAVTRGGRVTQKQVLRQFQSHSEGKLFAFIDAVAERHPTVALEKVEQLLVQGESPMGLFWALQRHFRMLVLAAESSPDGIAKELNLQPWRAEKLVKQARGYSRSALVEAYRNLTEADVKMKRSEEREDLTLERVVVALATLARR